MSLPTLSDFGIKTPAYIRAIRSLTQWNPEGCNTLEERARVVAENVFNEASHFYSIWLVSTDQELYSVIASLTEYRKPREQNIDFIWIVENELQEVGITVKNESEGGCLHAQHLHFNVQINPYMAEKLCNYLIHKEREAKRLVKKSQTTPILKHQKQLGCRTTDSNLEHCECEHWQ